METTAILIDQETQKIITTYQKIYNLIFKYGVFIILVVLSGLMVMFLDPNPSYSNNRSTNTQATNGTLTSIITSGDMYIANGVTLDPQITTAPLSVKVLQGFIRSSTQTQMGYGLLALKGGMILPISINMTATTGNLDKPYFSTPSYDPTLLQIWMQNVVLTYPLKSVQTALYQYKQNAQTATALSPAETMGRQSVNPSALSLAENFGLNCLGRRHVTSFFCHKNIEQFAGRIPYISLNDKLSELSNLMKHIIPTQYKAQTCDNLLYIFSRDPKADIDREVIFTKCGEKYLTSYRRVVDFATATYELQGISNAKLYTDDDINVFKLLSLQQKIYHNTLQKNYDVGTIEVYLTFVRDLLAKRQNIEQIYKDIIYLYNNTYLESTLTQIAVITNSTKAMLKFSDMIRNINGGTVGLQKMIHNDALLTYVGENGKESSTIVPNLTSFQELFASKFASFDSFVVTNQKVNTINLSAHVEGYFLMSAGSETSQVLFKGEYLFKDNIFILTKAEFPQNSHLEGTLASLIAQSSLTIDIPFIYDFIKNNGTSSQQSVSICGIISARRLSMQQCSVTFALFTYQAKVVRINFNGYKITSVVSTDPSIQTALRTKLGSAITTQENIGAVLEDLLSDTTTNTEVVTPPVTNNQIDTNQFTIISKFKKFLGVTPKSVNLKDGKYIVTFNMRNDLPLVALVDITNNYKISPLAIIRGEGVVQVKNFSLNLTNAALTEINQFKTDPWAYIKKVDPATYEMTHPK